MWLVLLAEDDVENHRPTSSHLKTLSYNVLLNTPHHEQDSNSLQL